MNLWLILQRPKIPMMWGKRLVQLKAEEKLSIEVADWLRQTTMEGKYKGVWHHIPNEGKRGILTGIITRAMGMHAGVGDFIFIWCNEVRVYNPHNFKIPTTDCAYIELKAGKNKQQPSQRLFQQWCELFSIKYEVKTSLADVQKQLSDWGAI